MELELIPTKQIRFTKPTRLLVCDPCYFFDNKNSDHDFLWQDMCEMMYTEEGKAKGLDSTGICKIGNLQFLYTGTAWGDGVYPVGCSIPNKGQHNIGVDAGLICAVDLDEVMKFNPGFDAESMGAIFPGFVGVVDVDGEGMMTGDRGLEVDTIGDNDDDEDDMDDEDEDY